MQIGEILRRARRKGLFLWANFSYRKAGSTKTARITDRFHKLYYYNEKRTWSNTFWQGTPVLKCPLDLWIYQELIYEIKPDLIIECGTNSGGSALFLASMCDLVDNGKIVSIDIEVLPGRPEHSRITYLTGSSTSQEIVNKVKEFAGNEGRILVILDSDHSKEHVLNELTIYSKLVTKNSYLIVEDSNINGHPVAREFGPGPMEAIQEFLSENKEFVVDETREKFYLTYNPRGYLKKLA